MTARSDLLALFRKAVGAVSPEAVMPPALPKAPGGRTVTLAVGKAGAEMMRVAGLRSAGPLSGLVVVPRGHWPEGYAPPPGVEAIEAGHPYPDENSVRAARRALALAGALTAQDRLLVLLSGGGSALLAAPARGVALADKQAVTRLLLASGAAIREINVVRKHLSAIKGGRLAAAAAPARVTTWIISDVPGDDPAAIASGPTSPDDSSLAQARQILARHRIEAPAAVLAALRDPRNETPAANSAGLAASETVILARGADALAAAAREAAARGYDVTDLGDRIEGEARALGSAHATLARGLPAEGRRRAIVSGGETVVRAVAPNGRGGRNLEYLLALAIGLDGAAGISALACDSDGIDGSGHAAGAILFPDTLDRARALGLDPAHHLARNDSCSFFERLGDLVVTGPTLTNVNDFRAILIEGSASAG
jgi:glycerate 2-kinase